MRLFLGIELPSEAAAALARTGRERWPEGAAAPRWYPAEDLHLTLRFLGELQAEPAVLAAALERLADVGRDHAPTGLELTLTRLGVFPRPGAGARVLWAGPDEVPATWAALAAAAEDEARGLGLRPERRPFRPHVTLARLRGSEAHAGSSLVGPLPHPVALGTQAVCLFSNRGAVEGSPPRYRVEARATW